MAKEKSEKRDKKEKKEKRSEIDGVKKPKKDKKSKLNGDNITVAIEEVTKKHGKAESEEAEETKDIVIADAEELAVKPIGALVPFANPLADDKVAKKVLKSVKKGSLLPKYASLDLHGNNKC
jgi:H/ACA ribonucleoprotein complex subunit 2